MAQEIILNYLKMIQIGISTILKQKWIEDVKYIINFQIYDIIVINKLEHK